MISSKFNPVCWWRRLSASRWQTLTSQPLNSRPNLLQTQVNIILSSSWILSRTQRRSACQIWKQRHKFLCFLHSCWIWQRKERKTGHIDSRNVLVISSKRKSPQIYSSFEAIGQQGKSKLLEKMKILTYYFIMKKYLIRNHLSSTA